MTTAHLTRQAQGRGFRLLWARERRRLTKAPALWIVIAVTIFMALLSVGSAKWAKEIFSTLSDDATAELITQTMPEPSVSQAYVQWASNLDQLLALILIVLAAQHLSKAVKSGDIPFILSRNVGRVAYLTSSAIPPLVHTLACAVIGTLTVWVSASLIFGEIASPVIVIHALAWLVRMAIVLAVTAIVAIRTTSTVGASAAGIATHLSFALVSLWAPAARWTFFGLSDFASRMIVDSKASAMPGHTASVGVVGSDAVIFVSAIICISTLTSIGYRLFEKCELD